MQEIKLLLIEDNPIDRKLFAKYLEAVLDLKVNHDHADTLAQAIKQIAVKSYDVAVLDLGLPDSQGIDTFYELHKHYPDLPIIIISGLGIDEIVKKAIAAGAQDYLVKTALDAKQLSKSIRFAIRRQSIKEKFAEDANKPFKLNMGKILRHKHGDQLDS